VVVQGVVADGPAARAGLRVGDTILIWNGGEVPRRTDRWLREQRPGDLLKLWVSREEKKVSLEFRLGEIKEAFYGVTEDAGASEKARHIHDGLLHGVTGGAAIH
jgi:predicted metalloprotease with PDZ domain